jgi:hypothetical protein
VGFDNHKFDYKCDADHAFWDHVLYFLFQACFLKQTSRQSNDNEYASLLNQIRFGIHTPDDIKWQLMYLLQNGLSALHLYPTRKSCQYFERSCSFDIIVSIL